MSNPHRGEADIELADGQVYTLKFNFEALVALQQATGRTPQQLFAEGGANFGPKELMEAIRVGLVKPNKLTSKKVAALLEPRKLAYYMERVGAALAASLGTGEDDDVDPEEGESDPL